jgi:hypothetical protein
MLPFSVEALMSRENWMRIDAFNATSVSSWVGALKTTSGGGAAGTRTCGASSTGADSAGALPN